jgi:hypothetical protein
MEWTLLVFRLPAGPSRHRVAVWRELRRTGAVTLGQSVWLIPATAAFDDGVSRVVGLVQGADGEILVLRVAGSDDDNARRLEDLYGAAREEEWQEFLTECARYQAEVAKEIAKEKFTVAELDEEEQSLERLRRWHRELRLRDVLGAPSAPDAQRQLKECEARLEDYTQRIFRALNEVP